MKVTSQRIRLSATDLSNHSACHHLTNLELSVSRGERAMERGVEIIAQGALASGNWFGQPDVLRRVAKPGKWGSWSYEAYDCKLARETKATTILQLSFYSELLREIQGADPESMWVVAPGHGFAPERYRVAEYAAYYRYAKVQLEKACADGQIEETYPEPCAHCDVCRWFKECEARLRKDDHCRSWREFG